MNHFDLMTTLIVAAVFIYAIAKQFTAKPVKMFGFVIVPLLALYKVYDSFPKTSIPRSQMVECTVLVLLALASAVIQSMFTDVFYQNDQLYMRSKLIAVVTWAVYFLARIGLRFLYHNTESWMMWMGMAVIFGARSLILLFRFPEIGRALSQRFCSDASGGGEQNGRRSRRGRRY